MKTAVIYASRYGYTRQYAEWLADDLGADLFDVREARAGLIEQYDILVLGGGVYAGKLNGIEWFAGNAERLRGKKLIYFAVGLRNPICRRRKKRYAKACTGSCRKICVDRCVCFVCMAAWMTKSCLLSTAQ